MPRHPLDMEGKEIRKLLLDKNVTQAEIARRAKVNPSTVLRVIDSDTVSDKVRSFISDALGIDKKFIWRSIMIYEGPLKPGRPKGGRLER